MNKKIGLVYGVLLVIVGLVCVDVGRCAAETAAQTVILEGFELAAPAGWRQVPAQGEVLPTEGSYFASARLANTSMTVIARPGEFIAFDARGSGQFYANGAAIPLTPRWQTFGVFADTEGRVVLAIGLYGAVTIDNIRVNRTVEWEVYRVFMPLVAKPAYTPAAPYPAP